MLLEIDFAKKKKGLEPSAAKVIPLAPPLQNLGLEREKKPRPAQAHDHITLSI